MKRLQLQQRVFGCRVPGLLVPGLLAPGLARHPVSWRTILRLLVLASVKVLEGLARLAAHWRVLGAGCLPRAEQQKRIGRRRRGDGAAVCCLERSTSLHFFFFVAGYMV
jgi:hypothetical protein